MWFYVIDTLIVSEKEAAGELEKGNCTLRQISKSASTVTRLCDYWTLELLDVFL